MPNFFPEGNTILPKDNELRVLMKLADCCTSGGGGGGGGGGGAQILWTYWEAAHVNDNPPPNPAFAYLRRFRNGDPPVTWDPANLVWV